MWLKVYWRKWNGIEHESDWVLKGTEIEDHMDAMVGLRVNGMQNQMESTIVFWVRVGTSN